MTRKYYFLVRHWNSPKYLKKCLKSILSQNDNNYTILFVDDFSITDRKLKSWIKATLKHHVVVFNKEQKYSIRNAYEMIHTYVREKNSIIINVDGDDWLTSDGVIKEVDSAYSTGACLLTYGNCRYYAPGTSLHGKTASTLSNLTNRRYPFDVDRLKTYRNEFFYPLHLRTWDATSFKKIPMSYFLRPNGEWQKCCEDQAIFFPLLEISGGNYKVLDKVLYSYNLSNPLNDAKVNQEDRLLDELLLRKLNPLHSNG